MKPTLKRLAVITTITATMFTSCFVQTFAAQRGDGVKKGNTLTVEHSYITADKKEHNCEEIKEVITYKGDKYKLKDVKYFTEVLSVDETVKTTDKNNFRQSIVKKVDGTDYTLTAQTKNIKWTEKPLKETLTEKKTYTEKSQSPDTIRKDGLKYYKQSIATSYTDTPFSTTVEFIGAKEDTEYYAFNGKEIYIPVGAEPTWDNYETDIIKYLGENKNNIKITSAEWTGEIKETSEGWVKTATYSGTKKTPVYTVTYKYVGTGRGNKTYSATIRYASDKYYEARAVAVYKRMLTTKEIALIVGGSILLLGIAGVVTYTIVKKKKDKTDDNNSADEDTVINN